MKRFILICLIFIFVKGEEKRKHTYCDSKYQQKSAPPKGRVCGVKYYQKTNFFGHLEEISYWKQFNSHQIACQHKMEFTIEGPCNFYYGDFICRTEDYTYGSIDCGFSNSGCMFDNCQQCYKNVLKIKNNCSFDHFFKEIIPTSKGEYKLTPCHRASDNSQKVCKITHPKLPNSKGDYYLTSTWQDFNNHSEACKSEKTFTIQGHCNFQKEDFVCPIENYYGKPLRESIFDSQCDKQNLKQCKEGVLKIKNNCPL